MKVPQESSRKRYRGRPPIVGHFHEDVPPTHFRKLLMAPGIGVLTLPYAFRSYLGPVTGKMIVKTTRGRWTSRRLAARLSWKLAGQTSPSPTTWRLATCSSSRRWVEGSKELSSSTLHEEFWQRWRVIDAALSLWLFVPWSYEHYYCYRTVAMYVYF
jgi:hypothetical protein